MPTAVCLTLLNTVDPGFHEKSVPLGYPSSTGFCEQSWKPLILVSIVCSETETVLLGLCTLPVFYSESVKKQTGPCQLPCHHCSSLLSIHRHCFSFHFPSGNLSCGFLLLGSKAKCWAFVLAEAVLAHWLGFKHISLLDVVPLVFWNVLEVHSLGGSLPFGPDTPVCSKRSTGGTAFSLV